MLVVSPGLPGIKIKGACLKNQRKAPLISPLLQPTLVQQLNFLLPSWFTLMYCINVPTMYKHRTPFGSMPNSVSYQYANSIYEHTTHRFNAKFLKFWTLHKTFQIITVTKKALKKKPPLCHFYQEYSSNKLKWWIKLRNQGLLKS